MQIDGTVENWYYLHYPVDRSADSSKHASNTISDIFVFFNNVL